MASPATNSSDHCRVFADPRLEGSSPQAKPLHIQSDSREKPEGIPPISLQPPMRDQRNQTSQQSQPASSRSQDLPAIASIPAESLARQDKGVPTLNWATVEDSNVANPLVPSASFPAQEIPRDAALTSWDDQCGTNGQSNGQLPPQMHTQSGAPGIAEAEAMQAKASLNQADIAQQELAASRPPGAATSCGITGQQPEGAAYEHSASPTTSAAPEGLQLAIGDSQAELDGQTSLRSSIENARASLADAVEPSSVPEMPVAAASCRETEEIASAKESVSSERNAAKMGGATPLETDPKGQEVTDATNILSNPAVQQLPSESTPAANRATAAPPLAVLWQPMPGTAAQPSSTSRNLAPIHMGHPVQMLDWMMPLRPQFSPSMSSMSQILRHPAIPLDEMYRLQFQQLLAQGSIGRFQELPGPRANSVQQQGYSGYPVGLHPWQTGMDHAPDGMRAANSGSFLNQKMRHTGGLADILAKVGQLGMGSNPGPTRNLAAAAHPAHKPEEAPRAHAGPSEAVAARSKNEPALEAAAGSSECSDGDTRPKQNLDGRHDQGGGLLSQFLRQPTKAVRPGRQGGSSYTDTTPKSSGHDEKQLQNSFSRNLSGSKRKLDTVPDGEQWPEETLAERELSQTAALRTKQSGMGNETEQDSQLVGIMQPSFSLSDRRMRPGCKGKRYIT